MECTHFRQQEFFILNKVSIVCIFDIVAKTEDSELCSSLRSPFAGYEINSRNSTMVS